MSRIQMTENKEKDESRSDNVVYVQSGWTAEQLLQEACLVASAHLRAINRMLDMPLDLSTQPISPSQPNLAPADAIVRDDEK